MLMAAERKQEENALTFENYHGQSFIWSVRRNSRSIW